MTTKGFTLVETMIAISILALSISGPLSTASRAIVLAEVSRDQLTASYLAQEAIEYVHAMRDDAYLNAYKTGGANVSTLAWTDFVSGSNVWSITQCVASACTFDPALPMGHQTNQSLATYTSNAPLYLSNGIYTQQQIGTQTPFTRTLLAAAVSDSEESITATVSWSFHGTPYVVTVTDHLTSWQ